jgi:hypothetical protein
VPATKVHAVRIAPESDTSMGDHWMLKGMVTAFHQLFMRNRFMSFRNDFDFVPFCAVVKLAPIHTYSHNEHWKRNAPAHKFRSYRKSMKIQFQKNIMGNKLSYFGEQQLFFFLAFVGGHLWHTFLNNWEECFFGLWTIWMEEKRHKVTEEKLRNSCYDTCGSGLFCCRSIFGSISGIEIKIYTNSTFLCWFAFLFVSPPGRLWRAIYEFV